MMGVQLKFASDKTFPSLFVFHLCHLGECSCYTKVVRRKPNKVERVYYESKVLIGPSSQKAMPLL